jgi:hypothetical protein
MLDQKLPFHEVLSRKLITAPVGIRSDRAEEKIANLMLILEVLYGSKMPAAAAHKIAEDNATVPDTLSKAHVDVVVVEFYQEVLDDLKNREDEKKPAATS